MARKTPRPRPTSEATLTGLAAACPGCGQPTGTDHYNKRTLTTRQGVTRFRLQVRRCHRPACALYLKPLRPERGRGPPRPALPHHEFGLDVIALLGALRHAEHRSAPEIHKALRGRGVAVAPRTVGDLLDRHARKELEKRVRGVRAIERKVGRRDDAMAKVIGGHCSAVRSALTDDGRPPLVASGLRLHERLSAIAASIDGLRGELPKERARPRGSLANKDGRRARTVRRRVAEGVGRMEEKAERAERQGEEKLAGALRPFAKVHESHEPGL